jgi:hypothetical protein
LCVVGVKGVKQRHSIKQLWQSHSASIFNVQRDSRVLSVTGLEIPSIHQQDIPQRNDILSNIILDGIDLNPGLGIFSDAFLDHIAILVPLVVSNSDFDSSRISSGEDEEVAVGKVPVSDFVAVLGKCKLLDLIGH